jgi:hypothetical protein
MITKEKEKVTYLLKNLDKIEAPKDFEFQVKKRISLAKSSQNQGFKWWKWAIASPMFAGILAMSIYWFANTEKLDDKPSEIVQQTQTESVKPENPIEISPQYSHTNPTHTPQLKSETTLSSTKITEKNQTEKTARTEEKPLKRGSKITIKKLEGKKETGFSRDIAVRSEPETIQPKGFNSKENKVDLKGFLLTIGVETETEKGVQRVTKVNANTTGERSGLKENDVIESSETEKTVNSNSIPKSFTIKSIKVKRENKILELPIKP